MLDRGFDGRRKEQRLAIGGGGRHDAFDGGEEAHIQHAVGFVQNQNADASQVYQFAAQKIAQPAGRGDKDLRAFADGLQLRPFVESADYYRGADSRACGQLGENFVDLHGKLARGAQHQGSDAGFAGFVNQVLNQRQNERECFPGAGLRGGDHIAASQRRLNSLRLYGGRFGKAEFVEVALQLSRQSEFRETFHLIGCAED